MAENRFCKIEKLAFELRLRLVAGMVIAANAVIPALILMAVL